MTPFDEFVAADWSGAKGNSYKGVAVARCRPGDVAPELVMPAQGRNWRRSDFVEWLVAEAAFGRRLLVGIDCNFALPEDTGRTIAGESYTAASLWVEVDRVSAGERDFYGGSFARHADYAHLFWHSGKRPVGFIERLRSTECACDEQKFGTPESPLKLLGARQVGKGGLAGMRVLAALKVRMGNEIAVWPFDPVDHARVVCVEIYPRLFLKKIEYGNRKVSSQKELAYCLEKLGCGSSTNLPEFFTDHEGDAMVAAAGIRGLAIDPAVWTPPGLDARARRTEGWIFGVS